MHYRDHYITPQPDGARWQVFDPRGRFVVSRPTQQACAAWVDRYYALLEEKNHELPQSNPAQRRDRRA